MKKLFFFLFLVSYMSLYAQEPIIPISYSEVVYVENVSADELFIRGQTWFAKTYSDSKSVLQMADNNVLVGKAAEGFNIDGGFVLGSITVRITYDISVECRDGRYKYIINNIVVKSRSGWADFGILTTAIDYKKKGSGAKTQNKIWLDVKNKFGTFEMFLVQSLKNSMQKGDVSNENTYNW